VPSTSISQVGIAGCGQDLNTVVGTLDRNAAEKVFPAKPPYSPYAGRKFATRPFFGDTHLHTAASFDAGAFGARDAYRFARGEEVMASSGQPATLSRPLEAEACKAMIPSNAWKPADG
jgi:hypothetical protein